MVTTEAFYARSAKLSTTTIFKNAKPNPYGIAYRLKSHLRQRSAGRCGKWRNWMHEPARDDSAAKVLTLACPVVTLL